MKCLQIRVENFRNIDCAEVEFVPEVNLFYGNNAQGKTNLLEAVFYGTIGKSFRDNHDKNLIKFGEELFSIHLEYTSDQENARTQTVDFRVMDKKKQILHNGVYVRKLSDFVGDFRTVLFCPNHLSLIKEGPAERRDFLDMAISQLYPNYLKALQKYSKILQQRNKLLRDAKENREKYRDILNQTLEIWSDQLAAEGAVISFYRWIYIQKIDLHVRNVFMVMMEGNERTEVSYSPSFGQKVLEQVVSELEKPDETDQRRFQAVKTAFLQKVEDLYKKQFKEAKEREIGAGTTLYGAHKDDMVVLLNNREARLFASQGQQRSLALAIKIGEGEISKQVTGEYPIFLFDDVLSELDHTRKEYLLRHIEGKQVIMTSCEPDVVQNRDIRIWHVEQGTYRLEE